MLPDDWRKQIEDAAREANHSTNEQNRHLYDNLSAELNTVTDQLKRYNDTEDRERPKKQRREYWTIVALFAAAFGTGALASFTAWQAYETHEAFGPIKDTADATRESFAAVQRPFITAVSLDVSGQSYGAAPAKNPLYLEFETTLENSGNTPTNDMEVVSSVSFDTPIVPYSPPDPANLRMTDDPMPIISDRFLGPHGKTKIGAISLFYKNVDEMIQERRDFYIFGIVRYGDQFVGTRERLTKYCFVIHPFKHEGGISDVQYSTTCHHWNCGDQDCQRDKDNYYAEFQLVKMQNPNAAIIKRPIPLAATMPYFPEPLIKAVP